MPLMSVIQDLSASWRQAVRNGKIVNTFTAGPGFVPSAAIGHQIEFGLTLDGANPVYFAKDLDNGAPIVRPVNERAIEGSDFVIQWNGYRALRPGGAALSPGRQPDTPSGAVDCRFHCQDAAKSLSLLKRDPLVQVSLPNWKWNAYYSAKPFEKEGHFLWLPVAIDGIQSALPHVAQVLTRAFVEDFVALAQRDYGVVTFFDSLHAGASVNHMHFQSVSHRGALAIEHASRRIVTHDWTLLEDYPANGIVFDGGADATLLWTCVDKLQSSSIPFNLIAIADAIYCIPRSVQHEVVEEFPAGTLASMELAGKMITTDETAYANTTREDVDAALSKTTLSADELADILGIGQRGSGV